MNRLKYCLLLWAWFDVAYAGSCADSLGPSSESLSEQLQEIADSYIEATGAASPLVGDEASLLSHQGEVGDHILSLGSGGDVFRPIRDFPKASHYHLIDIMTAWMSGPGELIAEVYARTALMGEIEVLDIGFLDYVDGFAKSPDASDFEALRGSSLTEEYWSGWYENPDHLRPLILSLRPDEDLSRPWFGTKTIYLHPIDFDGRYQPLDPLFARFADLKITGMLITGSMLPTEGPRQKFFQLLDPERGYLIHDTYRDDQADIPELELADSVEWSLIPEVPATTWLFRPRS